MIFEVEVHNPELAATYHAVLHIDVAKHQGASGDVARFLAGEDAPMGWQAVQARAALWEGPLDFAFDLVNPETSEVHTITLNMSAAEVEAAAKDRDPVAHICDLAYPILRAQDLIPDGFLPLGGRVRVLRQYQ